MNAIRLRHSVRAKHWSAKTGSTVKDAIAKRIKVFDTLNMTLQEGRGRGRGRLAAGGVTADGGGVTGAGRTGTIQSDGPAPRHMR